jgi:type IV pilus assembly protein PilE
MIELMIAIVVIGVLTAIAIPAYKNYTITGKIPLATSGLASEQVQMEQFFQDNQTYLSAPGCTGATNGSNSPYFTFSCSGTPTATAYTLQAVGTGSMAGFTYTVDQNSTRVTVAVPSGWTLPGSNCWVTRKGGVC